MSSRKLSPVLLLLIILLAGFVLRLYRFSNPIADWHSWRQVDTSAVSRTFVNEGFDLLHPKYHDLSNVPSGKNNPQGYRFVEFPVYNAAQAGLYTLFNGVSLEEWGRLVSIISSLFTGLFLYLLVKKYADATAGLLSAFFYMILPYSVFYSRTILPDTMMVMAIMGGIYFFDRWIGKEANGKWQMANGSTRYLFYCLAIIFTAAAFLLKPYAVIFTLPIVYLSFARWGFWMVKHWQLWVFLLLTITPLVLWRLWMTQFPEGIPSNEWLLNGGNIRFKGSFFYWLFADRIGRLILGYWGLGLLLIGILANTRKGVKKDHMLFFFSFLASTLLYLTIIARGNVQHDYYQILIIPSLAIFLGIGGKFLLTLPREIGSRAAGIGVFLLCTIFSVLFGWYFVRDYFNINNGQLVEAGKIVDDKTPKDAKVMAIYDGDTTFLYYTNRKGWASYQYDLPKMVDIGADYLVIMNPSSADVLKFQQEYEITASAAAYLLVKLQ